MKDKSFETAAKILEKLESLGVITATIGKEALHIALEKRILHVGNDFILFGSLFLYSSFAKYTSVSFLNELLAGWYLSLHDDTRRKVYTECIFFKSIFILLS